jgi:N-acyl-D-amino-acid deacylase
LCRSLNTRLGEACGIPRLAAVLVAGTTACGAEFDVLIRGGTVYDGSGQAPYRADIALRGDRIAAVGALTNARARAVVDAAGNAVAPGFINMLSWACESLIADGRARSDVRQGVTLEVMGEGDSFGPLNAAMKAEMRQRPGDIRYAVTWTTLGQYLDHLQRRGIAVNVASFVGATTVRIHELGYADRPPTPTELERMEALVRAAMAEGALGVASALIYAPGCYARTDELVALCRAAAASGGMYITHLRSEGDRLFEALDECLEISRRAGIAAEVYHLKAAGRDNWTKIEEAIRRIEAARAAGLRITADMYTYTAAGTGLNATMPPWVQEGGFAAWAARLRDPQVRARLKREMNSPGADWENFFRGVGSPDQIRLVGFRNPRLKPFTGKTLAEVAQARGTSPEDTIMDLVIEDGSRVEAVYFLMSEANVKRQLALPWVSFGSDEAAPAPAGVFLRANPHPRAYGNFARLLGRYVRDEQALGLADAIRRLTALPAENLRLRDRGRLRPGAFADVVVFDAARIQDHATYEQPHRYATGVRHVWVNGVQVLKNGEHTGATPGRVVRGPGWRAPER